MRYFSVTEGRRDGGTEGLRDEQGDSRSRIRYSSALFHPDVHDSGIFRVYSDDFGIESGEIPCFSPHCEYRAGKVEN